MGHSSINVSLTYLRGLEVPELEYAYTINSLVSLSMPNHIQEYTVEDIDSLTYKKESRCFIDVYVWYKGETTPVKVRGGSKKLAVCD